jgi:hypothetical protein
MERQNSTGKLWTHSESKGSDSTKDEGRNLKVTRYGGGGTKPKGGWISFEGSNKQRRLKPSTIKGFRK